MPKTVNLPTDEELEEIENFFDGTLGDRFQCFGCSNRNDQSLKLRFFRKKHEDKEKKVVFCKIPPLGNQRTSFPGVVHGGVISTIIDDTAYWTLFENKRILALTMEMSVQYQAPFSSNAEGVAIGEIEDDSLPKISVRVTVADKRSGMILALGTVKFFVPPKEKISQIMGPTGNELLNKL